jgi:hypothetical protein
MYKNEPWENEEDGLLFDRCKMASYCVKLADHCFPCCRILAGKENEFCLQVFWQSEVMNCCFPIGLTAAIMASIASNFLSTLLHASLQVTMITWTFSHV